MVANHHIELAWSVITRSHWDMIDASRLKKNRQPQLHLFYGFKVPDKGYLLGIQSL